MILLKNVQIKREEKKTYQVLLGSAFRRGSRTAGCCSCMKLFTIHILCLYLFVFGEWFCLLPSLRFSLIFLFFEKKKSFECFCCLCQCQLLCRSIWSTGLANELLFFCFRQSIGDCVCGRANRDRRFEPTLTMMMMSTR